ncbi:hypothetical protein pb186bvf_020782 [Paramecium bursaria]
MDIQSEYDRVFENIKRSAGEMEQIKRWTCQIPVDKCSKVFEESIKWPNSGDKLDDIYSVIHGYQNDVDLVRIQLLEFQKNKFQVIKEEEFKPKHHLPLIGYEMIKAPDDIELDRLKANNDKLQRQVAAFNQKRM